MGMVAAPIALLLVAWMAQAGAATLLCWWYLHLLRRRQPLPESLPPVLVLVPVRGPLADLDAFLAGLAMQDHPGPWRAVFALEDAADPSHGAIARFVAARPERAALVLAGSAETRGQKVQNLLAGLACARPEETVVVTLDADILPTPQLLSRLLRPILSGQAPISSGYRWSLPGDGAIGSWLVALADMGVATLPRCARCNICWGGATALRRDALDLARIWDRAVSDDLVLTRAARAEGLTIYAPLDALSVSNARFAGVPDALAFGARQFRLLRLHAPRAWLVGLAGALVPVLGGSAAVLALSGPAALPAMLCLGMALAMQRARAALRRRIAAHVLPPEAAAEARRSLGRGAWLQPLVPGFLLACALLAGLGGRRLSWAGRAYDIDPDGRLAGPVHRSSD